MGMGSESFGAELAMALELCDRADAIATASFERGPKVSIKPDGTPVTDADQEIERMIRESLTGAFPEDAVIGEEYGVDGEASREWIIDPIDGTKNFAGGIPLWSTLIGLRVAGEFSVGAISIPGIGQRFWAAVGSGAFHDGSPIQVSTTNGLADAMVLFGDIEPLIRGPVEDGFFSLLHGARRSRGFGDAWGYGLVASGAAEVMIEPELAIWDVAGPAAIIEVAGGTITQMDGSPLAHGGSALASNGVMHQTFVDALRHG